MTTAGLWFRDGLKHGPEFGAGSHAELGEQLVEVRPDRSVGEVQPLAYLPVGQPVGGQLCDLEFLGGELVPSCRCGSTYRLAGRAQLSPSTIARTSDTQGVEDICGVSEVGA